MSQEWVEAKDWPIQVARCMEFAEPTVALICNGEPIAIMDPIYARSLALGLIQLAEWAEALTAAPDVSSMVNAPSTNRAQ